jgi:two-component system CitB family sensor kinase
LVPQTVALQLAIIALVLLVAAFLFARQTQATLEEQFGLRSLSVAESVAAMPTVRENVADSESAAILQPIAEEVRIATGVSFVVIADREGIRRSHPNPERIGKKVSTDPSIPLSGISDTYTQVGTLGRSVRGKVPIYNYDGEVVGLVSVGVLSVTVAQAFANELPAGLLAAGLAMLIGSAGAALLAWRIRSQVHGLEPAEIAMLYERRGAMLLGIREGILGLDSDGRLDLVNQEATRLLGIDEGDLGRSLADASPSSGLGTLVGDSLTEHRDVELTIGDQVIIVNVMPVTVRDQYVATVVTLRDRTEIDSLVGELESVQGLVEALRSQAHEFSNTLHTISGLIELGRPDEVLDLISADLALSHQHLTTAYENQIVDPLLVGLLLAKSALAAERGIDFSVESEGLADKPLAASKELITIIGNLVDNAFDSAAGPRDTGGAVAVVLTRVGDSLEVEVRDNGPGIAPEVGESMFEESVSTKNREIHSGLGLTLVKGAVDRLGGRIGTSTAQNRTSFTVIIPQAFLDVQVGAV